MRYPTGPMPRSLRRMRHLMRTVDRDFTADQIDDTLRHLHHVLEQVDGLSEQVDSVQRMLRMLITGPSGPLLN